MIKYNPELFFCEYVKIKKITGSFVYITANADGSAYKNRSAEKATYQGHKVAKVKMHKNVLNQYLKQNSLQEFSGTGQVACLAFYDSTIIVLEVKPIRKNNTNKEWHSSVDKILSDVDSIIPKNQDAYINGRDIFWLDKKSKRNDLSKPEGICALSDDKCFTLRDVKYLSLSKIGQTVNEDRGIKKNSDIKVVRTIGSKPDLKSENLANLNFKLNYIENDGKNETVVAFVNSARLVAYNPSYDDKELECYSPVIYNIGKKDKMNKADKYNIIDVFSNLKGSRENIDNPFYLNLEFILKAGLLIGENYGYKETEILKIGDVIKDTGMVSIKKILRTSRAVYPINLTPLDGLAWLFKFIHKEKKLDVQRNLSDLFSYISNKGFVLENEVNTDFKKGKSEDDIVMLSYKRFDD